MQLLVPNSSSLLQAVQGLPQTQDIARIAKVIALRLLHVDLLFECAIDKGMRDVDRAKMEVLNGKESEDSAYGGHPDSRSEGFGVIEARALTEALCNQAAFVSLNGTVGMTRSIALTGL